MNDVARHEPAPVSQSGSPQASQQTPLPARDKEHLMPRVDIREDGEAVVLVADMPGVSRDGVSIEVHDGVLSIEGEMALSIPDGMASLYAEYKASGYARRFTLSPELDTDAIVANMEHGQLTIRLPRRASHQPRRIEVEAA